MNSSVRYIPEQKALEKTKKTNYFKLIFPLTKNELKVSILAYGTFKTHCCSHMQADGTDVEFKEAKVALTSTNLDPDIVKLEYSSKKKKAKQHKRKPTQHYEGIPLLVVAKKTYNKAI